MLIILCYVGVMAAMDSIASKFAEYEYTIRLLTAKLEETAAELERVRTEGGAHVALKEIYLDPAAPQGNRIKAAQAALTVEKPRLAMTAYVGKDKTGEVIIPLAELVAKRRRRQAALENEPMGSPKYLEWVERPDGSYPAEDHLLPSPGHGNGSDDDTAAS